MANRWGKSGSSGRFYFLGLQNCCRQWLQPYSQSYGFSSSHVRIWELDHKVGWTPKSWCFQTVVLEKTLESLLGCKEIKPVNPKGNQPWIFIGRTSWSWSSSTLATWCEELTHWKRLMLAKIESKRRRGQLGMKWLDSITDSMDMNLSKFQEILKDRVAWHAVVHGVAKSWTQLRDWTTTAILVWLSLVLRAGLKHWPDDHWQCQIKAEKE